MSLRSPMSRALGLGSAKEGAGHWWDQRISAVALVVLGVWFLFSIVTLPDLSHATVVTFAGTPWRAVLIALFVAFSAWHSALGVQVVIEDYVHAPVAKVVLLVGVKLVHVVAGAAGVVAALKLGFGVQA
ncbi:MAG: succinate dehydrogenase, hydrophobic membrane anchor protein [Gammaproteobacteria bacterium]|nr:succinate dehydrogenase, hydrophobic membrane anchor protein [Gammaproteobacteria bacterium]